MILLTILVTGGLGYIGSHLCIELLKGGYEIVIIDNLSNSRLDTLERLKEISKREIRFYQTDLMDMKEIKKVFKENSIKGVIHLAGFKAVGESKDYPIKYYKNNITGLINLLEAMDEYNIRNLVFSSSATVYGMDNKSPLTEDMVLSTTNPYGSTKLLNEVILKDLYATDDRWSIEILRYFNPVGAHESGRIGEDPEGIPNNLMPMITQVAIGRRKKILIYGNDYSTYDGTCIRDYIHVVDLAKGHLKALEKNFNSKGINIYNLGTGRGYSVLDVIKTFERVTERMVPYEIVGRRLGDVAISYSDPSKAYKELGWKAEKSLEDMCRDAFRWQEKNPKGYRTNQWMFGNEIYKIG